MDKPTTNIILLGDSTIDNILHVKEQDKTVAGCLKKNLDEKLSGDDLINDVIKDLHDYLVNNILDDIVEDLDGDEVDVDVDVDEEDEDVDEGHISTYADHDTLGNNKDY